ncbi:MAG: PAS domain S-box protein [Candidatus Omnitrophica bacterium]|nr:PAS domain S-box protein [Candidatus Omnitrophota bacterium]
MKASRRWWLLGWIIVVALLVGLGVAFHQYERSHAWREAATNLQAIARLKVSQIKDWRAERLDEASELTDREGFGKRILDFRESGMERFQILFDRLSSHDGYSDVMVVAPDGDILFSLINRTGKLNDKVQRDLERALQTGEPVLTDIHNESGGYGPNIDAIAPFYAEVGGATEPVGAIVLQNDASEFLYPLLQSWPVPTESAETLIVRREDDHVLFLNEVRYRRNLALRLQIPLTQEDVPAVMAVKGKTGVVEGTDYRGVRVLSALEPIPDSNWFMIAKVDVEEALGSWRHFSLFILGSIFGLVLAAIMVAAMIRQYELKKHYRAQMRAERARRRSETRFRTTLMSVGDGVIATDANGAIEFLNPVAEALTGWTQKEGRQKPLEEVFRIVNEETREIVENPVRRVVREGNVVGLANHTLLIDRGGEEHPIADSGAPIRNEEGEITGVVLVFRDQSEERRHQAELRESVKRHHRTLDNMLEGCQIVDFEWNYVYVNHTVAQHARMQREDLLGNCMLEVFPGIDRTELFERLKECMEGRTSLLMENEFFYPDGTSAWFELSVQPVPEGLFILSMDITARKQSEDLATRRRDRLLAQQETLASLIRSDLFWGEHLETAIRHLLEVAAQHQHVERVSLWRIDEEAITIRCSDLYERTPNRHSSGQVLNREIFPNYFKSLIQEETIVADDALADPRTCDFADDYLKPLGIASMLDVPIRLYGTLEGVLCFEHVGEKITWLPEHRLFAQAVAHLIALALAQNERRKIEEEKENLQGQLLQAQKLEAVGRLAGGVAHDFNNMLQAILGYTDLALEGIDPDSPYKKDFMEIHQAAQRSANLTRQLLAFARKQAISPVVLDLNDKISDLLKMLRRLIGEDINLAWMPGASLWRIKVDPTQVDQILANLVVNSRDAIAGVGKVTIETGNKTFDEEYCHDHTGASPGEFVRISVSDDGCGMDKETLEHVFEPFFSTKPIGEGTGLGLATVYGIVKQNEGFINVYSEPGHGTTFAIYLPRCEVPMEDRSSDSSPEPLSGGNETILIVEDEEAVLQLGTRILEGLGYRVLKARGPREALQLANENHSAIQLLITDVVMPEMNGRDLSQKLRDLMPDDLKVLFMSGYTADLIANRGVLEDGVKFIQKPFSMRELATIVRQTLDA